MLTTPLHTPEWLAMLRDHPHYAYRLLGALLRHAGPRLTMSWLDNMAQHDWRTPVPGLYTVWDVYTFEKVNRALIKEVLSQVFPPNMDFESSFMISAGRPARPVSRRQRRARHARIAVFITLSKVHRDNPPAFIDARLFELMRSLPPNPFSV